jgi:hypothetical protein
MSELNVKIEERNAEQQDSVEEIQAKPKLDWETPRQARASQEAPLGNAEDGRRFGGGHGAAVHPLHVNTTGCGARELGRRVPRAAFHCLAAN